MGLLVCVPAGALALPGLVFGLPVPSPRRGGVPQKPPVRLTKVELTRAHCTSISWD
jgi:hypothetical protein